MHRIPRDKISVENRQRTVDLKRDEDLRNSIRDTGLLHPIVLAESSDGNFRLVSGGRRLSTLDWLAKDGHTIICNKEEFTPGFIPALLFHEWDSKRKMAIAEFAENEYRFGLSWEDRARALLLIHKLGQEDNPAQTGAMATTRELAKATNKSESHIHHSITRAAKVIQHINDPAIKYARNEHEAYSLAIRKEEALLRTIIGKQSKSLPSDIKVIEGDSFVILPTLETSTVDLIIADPPYGIQIGTEGFRNRTVHHHNYADDPDSARSLIRIILAEGFRITRSRANIFIFCDIDLFAWLRTTAEAAGWTPFRTPIIWAKSDSEGLAPWGSQGPRRTYELIFFATKGQRGLVSSPVDILRHARVGRAERDYAAAKPVSLLSELINVATLPGEIVLDPCCGSGATLVAAKILKRAAIGIEKDNNAYNLTMAKLFNGEKPNEEPAPAPTDL